MMPASPKARPEMKYLTFKEYVLSRPPEDTPAGDFIEDTKRIVAQPVGHSLDFTTWDALRDFMHMRGAGPEAIKAGRTVWRRYCRVPN